MSEPSDTDAIWRLVTESDGSVWKWRRNPDTGKEEREEVLPGIPPEHGTTAKQFPWRKKEGKR